MSVPVAEAQALLARLDAVRAEVEACTAPEPCEHCGLLARDAVARFGELLDKAGVP